ncbi:hypothetical protein ACHAPJ_009497 [Fusarium lateritium]
MPRRSRGCAACRQRRIGCDEGSPSCRQCLITNRQCSGPLKGPVIIDQTQRTINRNNRRRDNIVQSSPGIPHQPSAQAIFAHAFISEFVSFITARNEVARRSSWLTELQQGSITDEGPALELSMQATALAYCGAASGNPAVVREACNIYGRALTKHSASVAQGMGAQRAAALCTCVMMSLFEAVCSTSSVAYATHLRAAQRIVELARHETSFEHSQVILQLGQHVQCQTLFVMITMPQGYIEHAPNRVIWAKPLETSLLDSSENVDRLMDCVFYLTDTLIRKSNGDERDVPVDPGVDTEIEHLWVAFQQQAAQAGECLQRPMHQEVQYKDPFIAMVVAYFAASRVILGILKHQTFGSQSTCRDLLSYTTDVGSIMRFSLAISLFAAGALARTPPEFFPSTNNTLNVQYGDVKASEGALIPIKDAAVSPATSFKLNSSYDSHIVLLVDLDAPNGTHDNAYAPFLHWAKVIPSGSSKLSSNSSDMKDYAPYAGPAPPPGTGPHRYVALLFASSNSTFEIPPGFKDLDMLDIPDRIAFNISKFIAEGKLKLAAGDWFTSENKTETSVVTNAATSTSVASVFLALGLYFLLGMAL